MNYQSTPKNQNNNKQINNQNKNNGRNTKKNNTKSVRKVAIPNQQQNIALSPCAREYAASLANPFTGPAACVPDYPSLLTRKVRTFSKGTLSTSSTTGFGYITMHPPNGVANDVPIVNYSTSAYTGTTALVQTPAAAGTAFGFSNSEYTAALFSSGQVDFSRFRVVSAGLRIRYIGTELNRGGQVIGIMDPDHSSIMIDNTTGKTQSQIEGLTESRRFPVDRDWKTVLYRPVDDIDNSMQTSEQSLWMVASGHDQFDPGFFYMTFYVIGASATTSLSYEWEAYANYEISGRNVRGKTPSHFDPTGFAAVHAATVQTDVLLPSSETPAQRVEKFTKHALSYLDTAISFGKGLGSAAKMLAPVMADVVSVL